MGYFEEINLRVMLQLYALFMRKENNFFLFVCKILENFSNEMSFLKGIRITEKRDWIHKS